jgi:BirA family biotin operon repressor/biotin-[acetyl-CoA-carboxylase] ligase
VRWPPPDPASGPATDPAPTVAAGPGLDPVDTERAELLAAATSIWRESGTAPEPLDLLGLLLEELERRLVDLADGDGRRRLASEYRRRCDTVGKMVRVSLSGEVFTGTATDITVEGHLIVDVGACFRTVAAGDVVHLRDGS